MEPQAESAQARGVTPRSVLLGLLLIPLNAYWVIQMELVRYQGHPTTLSLFFNTIFILLCLVLLNGALRRVSPRFALDRGELLVAYIMLNIGSALAGHDMIQALAPGMSFWARNATPENGWEHLFFRYIPSWLYCGDTGVIAGIYEGGDTFYRPRYLAAWVPRIFAWTAFLAVLLFMMMCLNSLFRRRWMEREKLTYPITFLPLEMTAPGASLFRKTLMWVGFAMAGAVDLLNGLHELWPRVPLLKVRAIHNDPLIASVFVGHPWGALSGVRIGFYPFAIGLGLLLPTDLLFSCWFFYILWCLELLLSAIFGWSRVSGFPFATAQSTASYLGLSLFALWVSREQIAQVASGVFRRRQKLDDRGEPMGYRTAVYGLAAGAAFLLLFWGAAGLSGWVTVLFFGLYFLFAIAVTRIRAELGPPVHDVDYGAPQQVILNCFGTNPSPLGSRNVTLLGLMWWFNRAYRPHPMPHQLEGYKMAQVVGLPNRRLSVALMLAAVGGALAAFGVHYHCFYKYGIEAEMSPLGAQFRGAESFWRIAGWLQNPEGPRWPAVAAMGATLAFTLLLMALRVRFTWWPFHPVGLALSNSGGAMQCVWLCLLIAWVAKVLILRYGGYKLYRSVIPLALGLILGEFVIGSLWTIVGITLGINTYPFWI